MSAPKPFPLSQFDTLTDGQPIGCVMGKLTKLYPLKTGSNSVGPWALQNAEIEQDGVSIPVCFKDRPELEQSWRGKVIIITAQKDKQLTGVYCWDDDRSTPQVRKLKITATATIDIVNADAAPAEQPTQNQRQPQNQGQRQPTGQTSTNQHHDDGPGLQDPPPERERQPEKPKPTREERHAEALSNLKKAKSDMLRIGNLHLLATVMVDSYVAKRFQEFTGVPMSEAQRQATTSSIFIKADKLGMDRLMPVGDLLPLLEEIDGSKK